MTLAKLKGFGRMLEAPIRLDYFLRNRRAGPVEFAHVFRIGLTLAADTLKLYGRVRAIKRMPSSAVTPAR